MAKAFLAGQAAADEALRELAKAPDSGETAMLAACARAAMEFIAEAAGHLPPPTVAVRLATPTTEHRDDYRGWHLVGGEPARLTLDWPPPSEPTAREFVRVVFEYGRAVAWKMSNELP